MKRIIVELGDRSYPVYLGRELLSTFGEVCKVADVPKQVVIVSDGNVGRLYLRHVRNSLQHAGFSVDSVVLPAGENQKTLQRANTLFGRMLDLGVSRDSAVVALGGGVIGDLTGFVAATFRRGVVFVQCPTTLLSLVDSSIGGKVGVSHPRAKNAIGTFYQPRLVFSDVAVLKTLPQREIISALGEILKYGIIAGEEMFEFLRSNVEKIKALDLDVIEETATRCINIKAKLVSEDERESEPDGGRAVLNAGHAVGQKMESLSNFTLRHGEAVLLGLRAEAVIARELGILSAKDYESIRDFLRLVEVEPAMGRRHSGAALFSKEKLARSLAKTKFVLPAGIGRVEFRTRIPEEVIRKGVSAAL